MSTKQDIPPTLWLCPVWGHYRIVVRSGVAYCAESQCDRCSTGRCGCDRAVMVALSPMHPATYEHLACSFHRSVMVDARIDRSVEWAKQEARDYARRRAHDVAEDLGLRARCCHEMEWCDGIYSVRCGRLLDEHGNCPRHDEAAWGRARGLVRR